MKTGEDPLIKALLRGMPVGRNVAVGPGDDCAVVRIPGAKEACLLKTDCIVEGVHFLPEHEPRRVGWKALCRALSDIGAMGGQPTHALVTILSPADRSPRYWQGVYRGIAKAARRFGVGIVGGETSKSPSAAISITLVGTVPPREVVTRAGGKAGDVLFVTGRLGGSSRSRHLDFIPRVREGQWLARHRFPRAMMDLSDGLGADLPRLAEASGCGFQLDAALIPRHPGCTIDQAIAEGEDYELLLAVAPRLCDDLTVQWSKAFPRLRLTRIGQLLSPRLASTKLPAGYDHFSASRGQTTS